MKYGHLVVLESQGRYRICRCDCGTIKKVRIDHLRSGATVSCGCIGRANSAAAKVTHGMTNTHAYKVWCWMLRRCKNDKDAAYGGRGIVICERWRDSFEAFYADMGNPPEGKSLDRIDVNGNYEPRNCRWANRKEQARNTRRNTYLALNGYTATIAEWSEITGLKPSTICVRLYTLGWSVEDVFTVPV